MIGWLLTAVTFLLIHSASTEDRIKMYDLVSYGGTLVESTESIPDLSVHPGINNDISAFIILGTYYSLFQKKRNIS